MANTEVLKEYFIWEEKNLIEPQLNCENNGVLDQEDITKNTKTLKELESWKDITDPKLRRKAYKKTWYEVNKTKLKIRHKTYNEVNKDKIKLQQKIYRSLNKDKRKLQIKEWELVNKDKRKLQIKAWKLKNKNNIQYKLSCRLRERLRDALNVKYKVGSAVRDLGCTVAELKTYLESKFLPGMNWDNYGLYGWHIDHIKPLSSFDLNNREEFLKACHYTNLQPLWWQDNLSKKDKLF